MKNILVTGSNGQLGSELKELKSQYESLNFIFTDVDELDLTDFSAVNMFFKNNNIDVCVNCAAYTAVDQAEDDNDLAMMLNYEVVEHLAEVCYNYNTLFVHISTDYVFDGKNYKPYVETDIPVPNSFYGRSKLDGEEAVMNSSCNSVIIRTSWLYSVFGNNFVKTMLKLGSERDNLNVVADQVGTPTNAADLAKVIMVIINNVENISIKEVYHYSNEGVISWYDFAKSIMDIRNLDCSIAAIESKDFPAKAARPFYSVLNKSKIKNDFKVDIPYWLDSLKLMLDRLK